MRGAQGWINKSNKNELPTKHYYLCYFKRNSWRQLNQIFPTYAQPNMFVFRPKSVMRIQSKGYLCWNHQIAKIEYRPVLKLRGSKKKEFMGKKVLLIGHSIAGKQWKGLLERHIVLFCSQDIGLKLNIGTSWLDSASWVHFDLWQLEFNQTCLWSNLTWT